MFAVSLPALTAAWGDPPKSAKEAARELERRQNELDANKARDEELQQDLTSLADERRQINERLVETAALVQRSEAQMTAIEQRLAGYERQEKEIRVSLAREHAKIASLLAALQRMGRNPPPVIITEREDALEMVRSAMLIARAFPEMRTEALALSARLKDLVEIMTAIRREGDALRAETERLNSTQILLASLLETKKQSLADRQQELATLRDNTAKISQNVASLSELIDKLGQKVAETSPEAPPAEPPADSIVAVLPPQPASDEAASDAVPGSAPPRGEEVALLTPEATPAPPPSSVVEMTPEDGSLVQGKPDRIEPAIAFQNAKGRLPLPAMGRRVLGFNEKTQYGGTSQGLVIETRFGARVTSPCDGWVVYAGEFRSYGQLLIINAGGGYHVLLAGLSHMDVGPGQFVLAAEPIGTMNSAPRTAQLTAGSADVDQPPQASAPVLYIEFRKEGQPIDSGPWWVASHQKVEE